MIAHIDGMAAQIDHDIVYNYERWNGTYESWKEHVQFLRDFVLSEGSDRVATMVQSAQRAFGLSDEQMRSYFGALVQAE